MEERKGYVSHIIFRNVENGYTVFEVVTILDSVDEYHIVKIEDNGLSPYDRIVLDASKVSENQIIFQ